MVPAFNINLQNEHVPSLIAASGGRAGLSWSKLQFAICNQRIHDPRQPHLDGQRDKETWECQKQVQKMGKFLGSGLI